MNYKMKQLILIYLLGWLNVHVALAQEKIIFIVDSIPVLNSPNQDLNNLKEKDIYAMQVITDKNELKKMGLEMYDKANLIITKSYHQRSDSLKKIPSVNVMDNKNGIWYLHNQNEPYSGPFINYYLSGDKYGEGDFLNGKLNGRRKMYYENGNLKLDRYYKNGIENGSSKEYFDDGTLKQSGIFKDGLEHGKWEMYFPNGQLRQSATFQRGKMIGETFTYYSTGKLKSKGTFDDGRIIYDDQIKKVHKLYNEGFENAQLGNLNAAINSFSKCIDLDPDYADAYFARGTAKLNNLEFDEAKKDFDKAIELEPYYLEAYANRAFCLIRKHQYEDSKKGHKRERNHNSNQSKDLVNIPEGDRKIICSDLNKTLSLGNETQLIKGALKDFCQ